MQPTHQYCNRPDPKFTYLGVHIYPDSTVELIPEEFWPEKTEKGKEINKKWEMSMADERLRNASSATRDVQINSPTAAQDCSDVVHISVFFDGTGNNKDRDEENKKWSNPARIWRSARLFADKQ